ncbi:SDR family NAD(P)-dependent oxidoreductase [Desulfosediminicola sp.]|uniref:SDR family NAD(P)-dependent oxidoreductase n=1 Tax=Desulfosediminicola sp. TaxID=2886825 RepID=UPI003AF2325A
MGAEVLITGVSGGLGKALAGLYLERGCTVYGLSRREPAELMKDERFLFSSVDLRDFAATEESLKKRIETKNINLVVLNAGILGDFGDMTTTRLEVMKEVMDVNLWVNKVILDYLFQNGVAVQQVVAISSGASVSGARGWNGYGISKAALNMMVKLYAAERSETHFCALAPGIIDSAMQEHLCGLDASNDYLVLKKLQEARNTKYMPQPAEAAQIVANCIDRLPDVVKSGAYTDVREFQQ